MDTPAPPVTPTLLPLLLAVAVAFGLGAIGCQHDRPTLSGGLGLGSSKLVTVGDVVTLRIPLAADGSRRWRVTEYDSFHLSMVGEPQVQRLSDGRSEIVVRARARTIGETYVDLEELGRPDGRPRRSVRFKVTIVE